MGASENPPRPDVTVVLGPWSSGTSAVASVVAGLGLNAHPPFVALTDARTPRSMESSSLRQIFDDAFNHDAAERLQTPRFLVPRLRVWAGPGRSVAKIPLLAWFLPELQAAWSCRFLIVHRPLEEIEATRVRRDWPALYGLEGAERIYRLIDQGRRSVRSLDVSYPDLMAEPEQVGHSIADFLDVPAAPEKVRAALRTR